MISKELLSEVTNIKILTIESFCPKNEICWTYNNVTKIGKTIVAARDGGRGYINIYEFADKCKEWIFNQGFVSEYTYAGENSNFVINDFVSDVGELPPVFQGDTEPEAVFKACEWILNQIKEGHDL